MGQRPALRAMLCATTLVSCLAAGTLETAHSKTRTSAIRLNSAHQRPVVTAAHVGVPPLLTHLYVLAHSLRALWKRKEGSSNSSAIVFTNDVGGLRDNRIQKTTR